ncbi:hypothetical protein V8F06_009462 [Rhypophila decipiens]
MTPQCVGMRSRDEVVVPPPPEEPEAESSSSSLRDRIGFTTERFVDDNVSVLDYKPIPLRWPFQVLLIAVIAGLFGFFEHENHDLPPVHFRMFSANSTERKRGMVPTMTTAHATTIKVLPLAELLDYEVCWCVYGSHTKKDHNCL